MSGRIREECNVEEPQTLCQRLAAVLRRYVSCLPDLVPTVLCLFLVYVLSIVIQTESNYQALRETYSRLLDLSNTTGEAIERVEVLLVKIGIDCGVEDLEMRNVKDARSKLEETINKRISKYDCVKSGLINWASSALGGRVVKAKGGDTRMDHSILGTPCYEPTSDPSRLIGQTKSGECWTFKREGKVLLQLATPVYITKFSVGHLPQELYPSKSLPPPPELIVLKGYRHSNDKSPHTFGAFEYGAAERGRTFAVITPSNSQFELVEFQFRSGRSLACVHSLQVHGRLTQDPVSPLNSG